MFLIYLILVCFPQGPHVRRVTETDSIQCMPVLRLSQPPEIEEQWCCQLSCSTPVVQGRCGKILVLEDIENLLEDLVQKLQTGKKANANASGKFIVDIDKPVDGPPIKVTGKSIKIPKNAKSKFKAKKVKKDKSKGRERQGTGQKSQCRRQLLFLAGWPSD